MKLKKSLAFPIIFILIVVAFSSLFIGYYFNINLLTKTLEERDENKNRDIIYIINSIIKIEINKLSGLTKVLKENNELAKGLADYAGPGGDIKPLQQAMDRLFANLDTQIFLVTDRQGTVVYRANEPSVRGDDHNVWGMDEALAGEDVLTASIGPRGLAIRSLAPIYRARKIYGVLILGNRLDDHFARKIAAATNTQITFGRVRSIFASSLPPDQRPFDPAIVERCILEKRPIFIADHQQQKTFMYSPLEVVDETICLIIQTESAQVAAMLNEKKRHLLLTILIIFILVTVIGSGLTLYLISPLKRLRAKAQHAIREFSGEELAPESGGNEIETLSQAFDLMLFSINQYIKKIEQAEDTLKFNERFLASIFDSIQDGISIIDTDYNIVRVNRTMERTYAQAMPLIGKKCHEAYYGSREPCEICPSRRTLETGEASREEISERKPNGELIRYLELHTFPLINTPEGDMRGVVEYVRDITPRRQAEEALHRSEEQLRQSQKMEAVGCLAGGVAHDFNNILTAIIGYVELLRLKFDYDDPRQKDLQEIQTAAERAASLTSQLLAFSRKQIFSPKVLNLNNLVMNLDKMLRRLISEDIDLVTVPGAKLGMVMADPGQIEQVVINLVVNARDAMPQGGVITIETGNVVLDAAYARSRLEVNPGPYVMVAVGDTGRGMDEVSQGRIFEPFFTTKELGKGTGLGLSTVHGIVKQSGGHISVYSEPGHGTTFKIYLPRLSRSEENEAAAPTNCPLHRGSETILLVEDEDMVRHVARRILELNGYTVLEASSGHDALSVSQQTPGRIHLMLTDVVMPGISGGETAELLKAQRPDLRVLFMSGHTENSIVHHGVLNPGVAFLQKPFKHDLLVSKVREVLDGPPTLH